MKNINFIEVPAEFVFLTIPKEYICVYHKLLCYLIDFGEDLVRDCSSGCKAQNKKVIDCWNMFQSACACYTLQQYDKANFFINYIKSQLDLCYQGSGHKVYDSTTMLPITTDGHIKATISCKDNPRFFLDEEQFKMYLNYNEAPYSQGMIDKNGHLIVNRKFVPNECEDKEMTGMPSNSVDTDSIKDKAITMDKLSDEVKQELGEQDSPISNQEIDNLNW